MIAPTPQPPVYKLPAAAFEPPRLLSPLWTRYMVTLPPNSLHRAYKTLPEPGM